MGTFGWDDEGVAAQSVPIVQDGIFVGYLSSRETAPRIGRRSGGAMRADGWNRIPLIRMTNINLLPKPGMSLDDIVADTDDGFYLASNRSLVDRRPPAELPVRDRGRLRDQGRQEGPALQEPDLHGHHVRVLAILRRRRRRIELRDARHAELRQGRARPGRPRRPRRAPVPGSGTSRSASASGERVSGDGLNGRTPADTLGLAERVLGFAANAKRRPRSRSWSMADERRLTRFANSEIHQNVAESNALVNLRFVIGKRVGVASTGRSDDEGLRRLAERAAAIARNVEELEDWGGLPEPTPIRDVARAATPRRPPARPRSSGPRASGRHRRRRRRGRRSPTARSRPRPRRSASPTRRASAPRSGGPCRNC